MKNLKWNKVFSLCKIQVAEFSEVFSKRIFLLPLFILIWPLLTSGGDTLWGCRNISFWILMLPIAIIPMMNYALFIGGNNKLMLPASHIEKYTSIWLSSILLTGIVVILSAVIILPILYGLNVVSFQEDFKEIGLTMISALSFNKVINTFAISIGTVLLVNSQFIPMPKKHLVYIVLVLSLVLYLALSYVLPHSVWGMYKSFLSGILSIGLWIWGYQNFKLIQLYKKK